MARLRALNASGELREYASRRLAQKVRTDAVIVAKVRERVLGNPVRWLRKAVPALYGPHADKQGVKAIREPLSTKEAIV